MKGTGTHVLDQDSPHLLRLSKSLLKQYDPPSPFSAFFPIWHLTLPSCLFVGRLTLCFLPFFFIITFCSLLKDLRRDDVFYPVFISTVH